jgi:hypothetical protein
MIKKVCLLTIVCCISLVAIASEKADPFAVGEKWVYKHDGPKPMSWNNQKIDGDMVRVVTGTTGEGEQKRWIIKETYGTADERPTSSYIDSKKQYSKMDSGSDRSMTYDPAVPYYFPELKVDEAKEIKTNLNFGQGGFPISMTYKRVADETVKIPAGEFKNCQHYKVDILITFNRDGNEFKMKSNRELWYNAKVNGLVKIVTIQPDREYNGQVRKGYTATSELKKYSKK